eukprot:jgi/Mesvir1/27628/Mv07360-RA.2
MASIRAKFWCMLFMAACVAPGIFAVSGAYDYCGANVMPSPEDYTDFPVDEAKLLLVQTIARHGDRSPIAVLPHEDGATWDCPVLERQLPTSLSPQAAQGDTLGGGGKQAGPAPGVSASPSRVAADVSGSSGGGIQVTQQFDVTLTEGGPFVDRMWKGTCPPGQLTFKGHQQLRALGASVRALYADKLGLLPADIQPSDVYVRATDYPRTQQSAAAFLEGLVMGPDAVASNGSGGIGLGKVAATFTIHTLPARVETLLPNYDACPRLAALRTSMDKMPAWRRHLADNSQLMASLIELTGTGGDISWQENFDHYFDSFRGRTCHGIPLPCAPSPSPNKTSPSQDKPHQGLASGTKAAADAITAQQRQRREEVVAILKSKPSLSAEEQEILMGHAGTFEGEEVVGWLPEEAGSEGVVGSGDTGASNNNMYSRQMGHPQVGDGGSKGAGAARPASPRCVNASMAAQVFKLGDWEYDYEYVRYRREEMARLRIGPFIATLRENVLAAVAAQETELASLRSPTSTAAASGAGVAAAAAALEDRPQARERLRHYQAHDTTVSAMLGAMGHEEWKWPPYAAHLLLELWSTPITAGGKDKSRAAAAGALGLSFQPSRDYWVRFWYNGELMAPPFCGQANMCSLGQFLTWTNATTPEDFATECLMTSSTGLLGLMWPNQGGCFWFQVGAAALLVVLIAFVLHNLRDLPGFHLWAATATVAVAPKRGKKGEFQLVNSSDSENERERV